ncbi:uncharacterized protein LOC131160034 [Malania oleifera]|uniref:uncharacterized protein LOC131160034 n=1 Tax=Malania oleifera TaxID=397392 RepID=UPI0025AE90D7|nr:uncharacterized protein LOC131160034 [Malania oleifera]XP_057971304.1 uncharacterized protein LOC131160034 [Malania oleifera]
MSSSSLDLFLRLQTANSEIKGFPGGSLTELVRVEDAAFILLNYIEGHIVQVVRVGDFTVRMIMRSHDSESIMLITTCMVEGLHWPLTRDAPVIRIGDYSFAFALPDLLYGVSFPRKVGEDTMDSLGMVFSKFGFYQDNRGDAPTGLCNTDPNFWMIWRPKIEGIMNKHLVQFGHKPGRSPSILSGQKVDLLRVIRMSATTHLVSKGTLLDLFMPFHALITIHDTALCWPKETSHIDGSNTDSDDVIYPSVTIFSRLVEAVDLMWAFAIGKSHLLEKHQPAKCLVQPLAFKTWTLNPDGILFVMKMLSHITTQKESANGGKEASTICSEDIKFPILEEYDI